VKNYNNTGSK